MDREMLLVKLKSLQSNTLESTYKNIIKILLEYIDDKQLSEVCHIVDMRSRGAHIGIKRPEDMTKSCLISHVHDLRIRNSDLHTRFMGQHSQIKHLEKLKDGFEEILCTVLKRCKTDTINIDRKDRTDHRKSNDRLTLLKYADGFPFGSELGNGIGVRMYKDQKAGN